MDGHEGPQDRIEAQRLVIERLTTRLERQDALIAEQRCVIDGLEERLARVERATPSEAASTPVDDHRGPAGPDAMTDRRQVLSRAATAAAGAVVGATALAVGQASPASAASGTFDGSPAVSATASPSAGTGVYASSGSGPAVWGDSSSGYALQGFTDSGTAIRAITAEAPATHLLLGSGPVAPAPPPTTTVVRADGSIVLDVNNDLWLCVVGGAPGSWRKLAGPSTAGAFHALTTPKRVYDSRPGFPPAIGVKAPLAGGSARSCDLKANASGVPAGASAVLVSLVATETTGAAGGFLAVYRSGIAWPGTSNLNWSAAGQNVAVTTLTAVDANASCNLYASQTTHVLVDVLGYYR